MPSSPNNPGDGGDDDGDIDGENDGDWGGDDCGEAWAPKVGDGTANIGDRAGTSIGDDIDNGPNDTNDGGVPTGPNVGDADGDANGDDAGDALAAFCSGLLCSLAAAKGDDDGGVADVAGCFFFQHWEQ